MKISIKYVTNPTLPATLVLLALVLSFWVVSYFVFPAQPPIYTDAVISSVFSFHLSSIPQIAFAISLLIVFFNGFLIAQLNNKYTLIRNRTFLPVFIFLLMLSFWADVQTNCWAHFATTLFLLSLFSIFGMYRNRQNSESAFASSLFLALAGFFVFPFIFFIPVYWIGMMQMKGFSLRTFLASIFGCITPWILLSAGIYYADADLHKLLPFFSFHWDITILQLTLYEQIYLGAMFIIGILTLRGLISDMNKDALQTRSNLIFMITLLISVFILTMIMPGYYNWLTPVIAVLYAFLVSYPLTLKRNNFYSILFYILCVINLAFFVVQLLLQLQWI